MPTLASGQIIPEAPALQLPSVQNIQGSALEAAVAKTQAANAQLAATAKAMGAGQKGGGAPPINLNASISKIPEGGTIKGVSYADVHIKNVDNLNQLRANAVGDKLMSAQPFDPTPTKGGRRTKRSRKAKNGRSNKRTHRRRNSKHSSRGGRRRGSILKSMAKRK
uniref:Uncharacterized protein n=1 Tax=viral metagenome TaxID=1070528 RepID=A0A6C0JLK8_9ZZZZ